MDNEAQLIKILASLIYTEMNLPASWPAAPTGEWAIKDTQMPQPHTKQQRNKKISGRRGTVIIKRKLPKHKRVTQGESYQAQTPNIKTMVPSMATTMTTTASSPTTTTPAPPVMTTTTATMAVRTIATMTWATLQQLLPRLL